MGGKDDDGLMMLGIFAKEYRQLKH